MTLYLIWTSIIVATFLSGMIAQGAQALLEPKTDDQLYAESDVVATGTVLETSGLKDLGATMYTVAVDEYSKGGELVGQSKNLQIVGEGIEGDDIISSDNSLFTVGDRATFYLDHEGEYLQISPYSRILGAEEPEQASISTLAIGIVGAAAVGSGIGYFLFKKRKPAKPLM
jgi:hypothetical protein